MQKNNNIWAGFRAVLLLLVAVAFSQPVSAQEYINGVPVDMDIENQLDRYLNSVNDTSANPEAMLEKAVASVSENTPTATRVRVKSTQIFKEYYEGDPDTAFQMVEDLLSWVAETELPDAKAEAIATQVEMLHASGKRGEAFLRISDVEIPLDNARMPRVRFYAHNLISRIYADWNRYDDALRHLLSAQDAVNETNNSRTAVRRQYLDSSISILQSELQNWEGALRSINKAIDNANKYDLRFDLANFYLQKSFVESKLGNNDATLESLNKAYDSAMEYEQKDLLAVILNNYGDYYMSQENWDEARSHLQEALVLSEQVENRPLGKTLEFNLGFIDVHQGHVDEGLKQMEAAVAFQREQGLKVNVENMLGELAEAYEFAGRYEKEAQILKEQLALKQELYQNDQQQNLANLQQLYESKDKEQQIELLERQNELNQKLLEINEQRTLIWLLLGVVSVFGAIFIFLMYRKARRANLKLKEVNHLLADQSRHDPLTGLWNRRALQEEMTQRGKHGERREKAVDADGLILLDLDFFKRVNDRYGHAAGDAVLVEISKRLRSICRDNDRVIRWGGEEFLMLASGISAENLEEMSERVLNEIADTPVVYKQESIRVTATLGFIQLPFANVPESKMNWEKVLQLADMALYLGKSHGRNRACGITDLHVEYEQARELLELDLSEALNKQWVSMRTIKGPRPPKAVL